MLGVGCCWLHPVAAHCLVLCCQLYAAGWLGMTVYVLVRQCRCDSAGVTVPVWSGWCAKRYGSKGVLGWAVVGYSCCTLLTPAAADVSVPVLCLCRVMLGLAGMCMRHTLLHTRCCIPDVTLS